MDAALEKRAAEALLATGRANLVECACLGPAEGETFCPCELDLARLQVRAVAAIIAEETTTGGDE